MKKKNISLILNIILILFEIAGLIYNYSFNHRLSVEFFTEDANILALVASSIFVFYLIKNESIPKWLHTLKYVATLGLAITFLVVIFILAPLGNFNYFAFMLNGTLLYHHTLCPIIGIVTFLFFDKLKIYSKKDTYIGITFTFIYGVVLIALNVLKVVDGPYPFLKIYDQPFIMSIFWFIIVFGFSYLIAAYLRILHIKYNGEILDIYNDDGKPINKRILRGSSDSEYESGEHFAVSIIFIENDEGEFLIQKLPNGKYSSTGGHVLSGEKPLDAVIRETKEEIGVRLPKKEIKYLGYRISGVPLRFLYYIKKNIDIKKTKLDYEEVSEIKFMSIDEINRLIKNKEVKKSHALLFNEVLNEIERK